MVERLTGEIEDAASNNIVKRVDEKIAELEKLVELYSRQLGDPDGVGIGTVWFYEEKIEILKVFKAGVLAAGEGRLPVISFESHRAFRTTTIDFNKNELW